MINDVVDVFIKGKSDAIESVKTDIRRLGHKGPRVLLSGENGTGKELVAKAMHCLQRNIDRPPQYGPIRGFSSLNLAGVPDGTAYVELFGCVRGAFNDARDRPGAILSSQGGTLFLDEIGDASTHIQSCLLHGIENGYVKRLGEDKCTTVHDVRVISASNRDLPRAVAEGRFREDLFYRLRVIEIHLPPLRERVGDIPVLIQEFDTSGELLRILRDLRLVDRIVKHPFPGNVRELRNLVEELNSYAQDAKALANVVNRLERSRSAPTGLSQLVALADVAPLLSLAKRVGQALAPLFALDSWPDVEEEALRNLEVTPEHTARKHTLIARWGDQHLAEHISVLKKRIPVPPDDTLQCLIPGNEEEKRAMVALLASLVRDILRSGDYPVWFDGWRQTCYDRFVWAPLFGATLTAITAWMKRDMKMSRTLSPGVPRVSVKDVATAIWDHFSDRHSLKLPRCQRNASD